MRAVLGILLIFGGLLLAYLILSGKFPPASASSSSSSQSTTTGTPAASTGLPLVIPFTQVTDGSATPVNGFGLPTVTALSASGGYSASSGGL